MAIQTINVGAVANDRTGDTWRDAMVKANSNFSELESSVPSNRVTVKEAADLSGTLLSTVEYFIDGSIDMGSQQIEIPAGGLHIAGYNFETSKLTSNQAGYAMFTSPGGGSGNIIGRDYAVEVTGTGAQVYDITSATGFDAFELYRINYNNCTSLGVITGYRQGLESGTGRFGGTPELTLAGTWLGGYFIDTSIVRSLTDGAYSLYKAGASFSMASRFRTNQNIDLPASASFFDFTPAQFANPSTVQVTDSIVSRNGVFDAGDLNITPNMTASDLSSAWGGNVGMDNTFEGGTATITTETATVVAVVNTFYDIAGTFTATDLQHFDSPASGQLRHLGNSPREYRFFGDTVMVSTANNVLAVKVVKWDNSAASFVDVSTQRRQVNSLVGGRDVAFFNFTGSVILDQNDYIKLQVENQTGANNVTAELDSFFTVLER